MKLGSKFYLFGSDIESKVLVFLVKSNMWHFFYGPMIHSLTVTNDHLREKALVHCDENDSGLCINSDHADLIRPHCDSELLNHRYWAESSPWHFNFNSQAKMIQCHIYQVEAPAQRTMNVFLQSSEASRALIGMNRGRVQWINIGVLWNYSSRSD